MKIELIIILLVVGFAIGYMTKDLLTTERKVTVNVKKQKVKGEGNVFDAVIDVDVDQKKERKGLLSKWKGRIIEKRNKPK